MPNSRNPKLWPPPSEINFFLAITEAAVLRNYVKQIYIQLQINKNVDLELQWLLKIV